MWPHWTWKHEYALPIVSAPVPATVPSWPHRLPHRHLLFHPPRYADNFDNVNNVYVIVQNSDKPTIEGYGSPEEFIGNFGYLLGKQAFSGALQLALTELTEHMYPVAMDAVMSDDSQRPSEAMANFMCST